MVARLVTKEDGKAVTEPLFLGRYHVVETKAPYGMILNPTVQTVELTYAGQEVEITETSTGFYNERQKVEIDLNKVMEQNEAFGVAINLENTTEKFGLFAAEDFDVAVKAWLEERPVVRDYLKSTDRHLMQDLDLHRRYVERVSGPYGALPSCWTHGDPHISNFLWQGDRPSSIFDFGLADRNTALFDLVETLERNTIRFVSIMNGDDDAYCADTAAAIIRGYNGVIPLSPSDLALVADMLPVCQSEAELNWIAYYVEGTHRPQDAAWCYDISLMGHTAWFARPSGQRYLDAIRMAA